MAVELIPKHKLFADEYLICLNATEAYKKVYKVKDDNTAAVNGSKLLRNTKVSAYVKDRQAELSEKTGLTHQWVLEKLEECVHKSMQEEEVMQWDYSNKEMRGTGEFVYDSKGATKALELIGKHLGMFKNDNKVDVNIGVQIVDDIK